MIRPDIKLMRSVCLLSLLCAGAGGFAQRPPSQKQWREVIMHARHGGGELVELPREEAWMQQDAAPLIAENQSMPRSRIGARPPAGALARLPGAKAKARFQQGEAIEVIAHLPEGADPQQVELLPFETEGKSRIAYLRHLGGSETASNWNALLFRYSKQPDGQWKLQPIDVLAPGEYCFSPRKTEDNYCFGVDAKETGGAAQPPSGAPKGKITMDARDSNGNLTELTRETAAMGAPNEPVMPGAEFSGTPTVVSRTVSPFAVLPEPKAKKRFSQGELIEIMARLPDGSDPRQLELRHFLASAQKRYFSLQNSRPKSPAPYTVSFRASRLPDGQWKLQPALELRPGEYCFAAKSGSDHFCFGVDPK